MSKHTPPPFEGDGDRIIDEPLSEALSRRYLAYALSTITNRALPDVRDGLKPGDQWCLCAPRWKEALDAGAAPKLVLASTHEETLAIVPLEVLKAHAVASRA